MTVLSSSLGELRQICANMDIQCFIINEPSMDFQIIYDSHGKIMYLQEATPDVSLQRAIQFLQKGGECV